VPPFVGVAVKTTHVPEQIVFEGLAEMDTDGTKEVLTTTFTVALAQPIVSHTVRE
jgi:hypothetical protein